MKRSAIVIGGGIAGLSAGIALRKAGYDVTVFEKAPRLEPIGAALSIWGNAMAGLDWLGCGSALRARAAQVRELLLTRVDGQVMFGPVDVANFDAILPLRSDLQAVLLDAFGTGSVRLNRHIDNVVEAGGKAMAVSGGETVAEADLAIVADGIHSPIATRLLGNAPVYRGYGGVIGVCRSPDDGLKPGLAQEMWAERDRFGLFDAGDGRRYWFYMAPFAEPGDIASLDHAAIASRASLWPAPLAAAVAASDPGALIALPIRSRPMPRMLGKGRVVCIGDAAHAMEPNQGQGACHGIEDAWLLGVLAQRLAPPAVLPEFQRRRLPRIRGYWRDSSIVGRVAHSPSRFERAGLRAVLTLAPKMLDRRQILRRHAPPDY